MKNILAIGSLVVLSSCGPMAPAMAQEEDAAGHRCISLVQAYAIKKEYKLEHVEVRGPAVKTWLAMAEMGGAELKFRPRFVVVVFYGDRAFVMFGRGNEMCHVLSMPTEIANQILRRA